MRRLLQAVDRWPLWALGLFSLSYCYFAGQLLWSAWVTEDAYITFRTLDNWLAGYGLRWNVAERVQAHTNPLWLFVHAPFYALWQNIYALTLVLSAAFTLASVGWVAASARVNPVITATLLVWLASSKAWRDFTISGLENPLTCFLLGAFWWVMTQKRTSAKCIVWLALLSSALALSRLDTLVFIAPCWLWLAWQHRRVWQHFLRQSALGALPLVLWLGFSFFYYGFFFPNTKYAKLTTGIERWDYLKQGSWYALDFLYTDAAGVLLVAVALLLAAWAAFRRWPGAGPVVAFALGCLLHIVYVLLIGGDFMSGRFFNLPVFASALMLAALFARLKWPWLLAMAASTLAISFIQPALTKEYWRPCNKIRCFPHGIADERAFFKRNWLIRRADQQLRDEAEFIWAQWGRNLNAEQRTTPYITGAIGMMGYYAGPKVHIIDVMALADPLLARMPIPDPKNWRPGHFQRPVPVGYAHAVQTGDLSQMEPGVAQYYEKLRLVTRGELWSLERLETALGFALGRYDALLQNPASTPTESLK